MQNNQLVNEDYLSNLIVLAREQQDEGLIPLLFQNLQAEYQAFSRDCRSWLETPERHVELQERIHRLKNNFFSLGCEEVGRLLEDLNQYLKVGSPERGVLASLWIRFESASDLTFQELRKKIDGSI